MSRRIEAHGGLQLTFPEASTIFVIPGARSVDEERDTIRRYPVELTVEPGIIWAVVQDLKDHGIADVDTNGRLSTLVDRLTEARTRGFSFDNFTADLNSILDEAHLEGKKMGSPSLLLVDAKLLITNLAEEIWTEP
ncbi:hypothetical protein HYZ70_00290 [Candidatus Curtissbacteria bacterium]|nr:hypothetical protein [Candidatus Curtissbacteria bacterium]